MGLGNRISVPVASAPGVGTISLGLPNAGFTTFGHHYSSGQSGIEYWAIDGDDWEHGLGTWTSAGNSLARDTILETLVSGTYDDSSPAAIFLSASANVIVAPSLDRFTDYLSLDGGDMRDLLRLEKVNEIGDESLASIGGTLTIALNGKVFRVVLTEDTTLALVPLPAPPYSGACELELVQDATGGWLVSFPVAWRWPDGNIVPVDTAPNSVTRYVISSNANGAIVNIDGSVREVG